MPEVTQYAGPRLVLERTIIRADGTREVLPALDSVKNPEKFAVVVADEPPMTAPAVQE